MAFRSFRERHENAVPTAASCEHNTRFKRLRLLLASLIGFSVPCSNGSVIIETVTVADPGNVGDTQIMFEGTSGYGSVGHIYAIGKYEVTLNQYTTFLNAVAKLDPYGLYNPSMATSLNSAGISRANSAGNYEYSVIGDGDRPVSFVSWYDAARFTNWLHNGQPEGAQVAGVTESGAYILNGFSTTGLETKNVGAQYWIPTENEWYKAAYYDPTIAGANKYWQYATRSDNVPGNVVGGLPNQANHHNGVWSVTQTSTYSASQNYLTPVGAFSGSSNYYGTYDQNGNVYEWNEAIRDVTDRGLRGGSFAGSSPPVGSSLISKDRDSISPTTEVSGIGFRIATVPEPSVTGLLLASGMIGAFRRRR